MLSISQAAKETRLSIKSIRHYEAINLIPAPPRDDSGYRYYPEALIKQLRFIQSAKEAGFNLKECKTLLHLCEDQNRSSADVKAIAEQKIAELEARIAQQQTLLAQLKKVTRQCQGDTSPSCPILEAFST